MKTSLLTLFAAFGCVAIARSDLVPSNPKTPLFELYEMKLLPHKGPDPRMHQMKAEKLLLSVYTLRDLLPLPGGARVTLTEKDARSLVQLSRTHEYLILVTPDSDAGVVMHFSSPIEDGVIPFTPSNYSSAVAKYIRQRFAHTQ
jgi:hypothetical protein